jgi:drug/metabolite transporter (DMT)-like permease
MYYLLIILSVVMFGGSFALKDAFRKLRGSSLKISIESTFIGCIVGLIVLLIINGLNFEFTPFTLLMAFFASLNGIAFTFCAIKALDYINLSLFSVFAMLGGMALPFFQGIIFYGELITIAKVVCVVFICIALALTIEKGEKKKGTLFYVGVFILNGMSGVISKIFTSSNFNKTSAAGYSVWIAFCTIIITGLTLIIMALINKTKGDNEPNKLSSKRLLISYGISGFNGAVSRLANFLLVVALANVDASVQNPIVAGGTMITSTIICYFSAKKPSKKELYSVAFAFIGMLALFLIPV